MRLHASKIKLPEKETHYRYEDWHYPEGLMIRLHKYYSVFETKCYHFVVDEHTYKRLLMCDLKALSQCKDSMWNVKKVMKGALRSKCHESKESALYSYKKRKQMQLHHAETAASKATLALRKLNKITPDEMGESINCGLDAHLASFIFD